MKEKPSRYRQPYFKVKLVREENTYSEVPEKNSEETEQCNDNIFFIFMKLLVPDLKGMISLNILLWLDTKCKIAINVSYHKTLKNEKKYMNA